MSANAMTRMTPPKSSAFHIAGFMPSPYPRTHGDVAIQSPTSRFTMSCQRKWLIDTPQQVLPGLGTNLTGNYGRRSFGRHRALIVRVAQRRRSTSRAGIDEARPVTPPQADVRMSDALPESVNESNATY